MTAPTTVHAVERGRAPASLPRSNRVLETAHFDVIIPPATPLHIGQVVRVNALTEANELGINGPGGSVQPWYTSTPADIEGRIVGIRTLELAVTEFIVLNEVKTSLVEHAYLTIQHAQGTTVALDIWRRVARMILLPLLPHTRHIPIEHDAVVILEDEPHTRQN